MFRFHIGMILLPFYFLHPPTVSLQVVLPISGVKSVNQPEKMQWFICVDGFENNISAHHKEMFQVSDA